MGPNVRMRAGREVALAAHGENIPRRDPADQAFALQGLPKIGGDVSGNRSDGGDGVAQFLVEPQVPAQYTSRGTSRRTRYWRCNRRMCGL